MLLIGLFLLVTSFLVEQQGVGMFLYGVWWALAGVLLLRRSIYGIVLLYMALADTLFSIFRGGLSRNPLLEVATVIWLGLPGLSYYPFVDDGMWSKTAMPKQRRRPESTPRVQQPATPLEVSDEGVQAVLRDIKKRREKRQQEPRQ
jgi:hypothetical protein